MIKRLNINWKCLELDRKNLQRYLFWEKVHSSFISRRSISYLAGDAWLSSSYVHLEAPSGFECNRLLSAPQSHVDRWGRRIAARFPKSKLQNNAIACRCISTSFHCDIDTRLQYKQNNYYSVNTKTKILRVTSLVRGHSSNLTVFQFSRE